MISFKQFVLRVILVLIGLGTIAFFIFLYCNGRVEIKVTSETSEINVTHVRCEMTYPYVATPKEFSIEKKSRSSNTYYAYRDLYDYHYIIDFELDGQAYQMTLEHGRIKSGPGEGKKEIEHVNIIVDETEDGKLHVRAYRTGYGLDVDEIFEKDAYIFFKLSGV